MSCEQRLRRSNTEGAGSAQHDARLPEVRAQVLGDSHNLRHVSSHADTWPEDDYVDPAVVPDDDSFDSGCLASV